MRFARLLDTEVALANFRARLAVPNDVVISYYHEDNIALEWHPHVVFVPLMAILKRGVKFLVDPLILRTLWFYSLCLD